MKILQWSDACVLYWDWKQNGYRDISRTLSNIYAIPIRSQCTLSLPPKNIRKSEQTRKAGEIFRKF